MHLRTLVLAGALSLAPGLLYGQFDFHIADRDVQVHSFASQGFAYSDENNYLSMHTKDGSFSMTDGGINVGSQLTDKLHVGAQLYLRNVGHLGNWKPELDWWGGDYKVTDWLGFRGGKVKTTLGLFNDSQDLTFLYTWALMPQSVYPVDSRGDNIAHIGGDIFGNIRLNKAGSLAYTVYGGQRPSDMESGLIYGNNTSSSVGSGQGIKFVLSNSRHMDSYAGPVRGGDLRWNTPIKGLVAGTSYMNLDVTLRGKYVASGKPYENVTAVDNTYAFYTEYTLGGFNFAGEYRRQVRDSLVLRENGTWSANNRNARQGYVSAAYRFSKWFELGAYHSRFIGNWQMTHSDPLNHEFDTTVAGRVDLKSYLDFKAEGHFIDGCYVNSGMSRGFFVAENTNGFAPKTKLLVIKLEYHL